MSLLMDASSSTVHFSSNNNNNQAFVFDSNLLQKQSQFPAQFVWPKGDLVQTQEDLNEPVIDMEGFLNGDEEAIAVASELIRAACINHGFFQVTNHGVEAGLIRDAYAEMDRLFKLPLEKKLSVRKQPGSMNGYSGAHAERFSSKLPWKETFTVAYRRNGGGGDDDEMPMVVAYFQDMLGQDFEQTGWVYQKYCKAMRKLSLAIFELLAISLGVDRMHYRDFFEESSSIMRCNYYPPCNNSGLTLGTGPHCDPTSLTILNQDQVGGLEVFSNDKWLAVRPHPDAFVINIGDTFSALSNGKYKSCLHRAVVKREQERRSLAFFVSPKEDKVVRAPEELGPRNFPDFTWSDFLDFTQRHYRADSATLQAFVSWLLSSKQYSTAAPQEE